MFGPIGGTELLLILVIALIIFGPRKLPEIGKSMGRMMAEFRRASNEFKRTIEDEVEAEKTTAPLPPAHTPPEAYDPATEGTARETPPATPAETPATASPEEPTVSRDTTPTPPPPIEPR